MFVFSTEDIVCTDIQRVQCLALNEGLAKKQEDDDYIFTGVTALWNKYGYDPDGDLFSSSAI
jgi:hypothetical protein